jgi:hypothetical protein
LIRINHNEKPCEIFKRLQFLSNPPHPRKYQPYEVEPELVDSKNVKLRGIHIKSTAKDSPNLIFFPEAFDQAENWLNFFSNPTNKVHIIPPRSSTNAMFTFYIRETLVIQITLNNLAGKTLQV